MNNETLTLPDLGWSAFFQSQLSIEEVEGMRPLRVTEVHRNSLETIGVHGSIRLPMHRDLVEHGMAVGDWVLTNHDSVQVERVLDRKSLIKRGSAGLEAVAQLIAANIDTLFIVSSCNADFNIARLERYMALAHQAEVEPVVVLTKVDMCDDPDVFLDKTRELQNVITVTIDATTEGAVEHLAPWCGVGQTVALVGSSGVGKSTITNTMTGLDLLTRGIREDDAKGVHTTTARSMYRMVSGGWLIDTPGMRALRLVDARDAVDSVFEDISDLALTCKFNDCAHESEPGCAIRAAVDAGTLNEARIARWQKLVREENQAVETIAESRARHKKFHKEVRVAQDIRRSKKGK
ncbi:ribosome small subunit-dependent GTPase A [Rhodobacterales bacterium 52_120_T64]|nr:ribosome small subunit-dependent GTPase A [Rhodobacterales bacterium 52_120_T64]